MRIYSDLIDKLCEVCSTTFTTRESEVKRGNGRFCSSSCSAKRNRGGGQPNKKCSHCDKDIFVKQSKITRTKTGLFFCSKTCMDDHTWRKQRYGNEYREGYGCCIECNTKLKNKAKKFCNTTCQSTNNHKEYIKRWLNGEEDGSAGEGSISTHIRKWLFEKNDSKCQKCGWAEVHSITGKIPLTINHISGDWSNNHPDNIELICPNCHSLTINYGSLNKGKGRPKRRKLQIM